MVFAACNRTHTDSSGHLKYTKKSGQQNAPCYTTLTAPTGKYVNLYLSYVYMSHENYSADCSPETGVLKVSWNI